MTSIRGIIKPKAQYYNTGSQKSNTGWELKKINENENEISKVKVWKWNSSTFQKPEISCHIGRIGRGNARTIDLETPLSLGKYILMPTISLTMKAKATIPCPWFIRSAILENHWKRWMKMWMKFKKFKSKDEVQKRFKRPTAEYSKFRSYKRVSKSGCLNFPKDEWGNAGKSRINRISMYD